MPHEPKPSKKIENIFVTDTEREELQEANEKLQQVNSNAAFLCYEKEEKLRKLKADIAKVESDFEKKYIDVKTVQMVAQADYTSILKRLDKTYAKNRPKQYRIDTGEVQDFIPKGL